ncbi:MAG: glycosyltransferase family 2 protein [Ruminococcaceae bacterium]|nr:glycosyltransferase family 2 protein [Oscillospiraceae bacterium]
MDLQVLVVSMYQSDFSLMDKMNIRTNAIIANQTSCNGFEEREYEFGKVKMISTQTRGVGLNRNIALLASEADILLFSDDDMCYYDGALNGVKEAFAQNTRADVIIFSTDITRNGTIVERRYSKRKRAHIWNSMKYGTYAIGIRRKSLLKANLKFNELFGGGCPFSCGEDSLFIKACLDHSLKVYTDPYVLGTCCKDSSSWFTGYNEKYLYDKGVLYSFLFPRTKYLLAYYYGYRLKNKTKFSVGKNIAMIKKGIKNAKSLKVYDGKNG